ncbi:MAG: transcriptional repressor [Candidatus Levybacteria bacterium]|nr:transcriptional repressor [Candidatus Levybacteria bacterium]
MNINQQLHQTQLKKTPARMAVLSYLHNATIPMDADSIFDHLKLEHEAADRATVYRILEAFSQKGLVKRLEFGEGKYRYELSGDDHHHLICESCGAIEDISDCNIAYLEKDIKNKKKFLVKRHSLEFYGQCRDCRS